MSELAYFVGLDVAAKQTAVCIVDANNAIVAERKVATDPEAIANYINSRVPAVARVGLEAGPMSEWLTTSLINASLPAICVETRHAKAFISSQINKNDRNDARGLASMMMCGVFKPVHIKSLESQQTRALLGTRKIILDQLIAIELHVRGTLKTFGLRLEPGTRASFPYRVDQLVGDDDALARAIRPLLHARDVLEEEFDRAHRQVIGIARDDEVCALLMTAPAVGPVTALTFKCAVDDPSRLRGANSVGALFGMTPRQYQSGEINRMGGISKLGGDDVRAALCEAGMKIITTVRQPSALRNYALEVAERKGRLAASVAVGRRLGGIMRRMWLDGRPFDPGSGR